MRALLVALLLAACDGQAVPSAGLVPVTAYCAGEADSHGYGVAVGERSLLTAAHVVRCPEGQALLGVRAGDEQVTVAEVGDGVDVARLEATAPTWEPVPLGAELGEPGQSGRPVYDEQGRVVGLVTSGWPGEVRVVTRAWLAEVLR